MWYIKQEKDALPPLGREVYALVEDSLGPRVVRGVTIQRTTYLQFMTDDVSVEVQHIVAWRDCTERDD